MIWSLIGGLRGLLSAIGGAGAAFLLFMAWNTLWDNPRVHGAGKAEGRRVERIAWEEQRLRTLRKMESDRAAAQKAIDQAEADYLKTMQRGALQIAALEEALLAEKADNDKNDNACAAGPAIPRGLSRALDQVGR